jgi:hypothetical protein
MNYKNLGMGISLLKTESGKTLVELTRLLYFVLLRSTNTLLRSNYVLLFVFDFSLKIILNFRGYFE